MADATYKVTFESAQLVGKFLKWKNVFWSKLTDIATLKVKAEALRAQLDELIGAQTVIRSINFKNLANTRLSQTWWAPKWNANTANLASGNSDYPTTAINTELVAADGRRTRIWISGVEDDHIQAGGLLQTNLDDFKTKFLNVKNQLIDTNAGWVIRYHDPAKVKLAVSSFNPTDGTITLHAGHGLADNTLKAFTIAGFVSPQINGQKKLKATGAQTLKVDNWVSNPNLVVTKKDKCYVEEVGYECAEIKDVLAVRSTGHDRGRPT